MAKERLQKVMASAGVASRRQCEELILQGMVGVNGRIVDTLPAFVDPQTDVITVGGQRLQQRKLVYFLLNKPKGVICTSDDPQGRPKATDLVPPVERVFCVGRLDADTTGLILLTNDAELTDILTHPRYKVPKTYVARVAGRVEREVVAKLRKGVWLAEGRTTEADVKVLKSGRNESLVEVTIRQGLNRQVRRMLAKVGLPVQALKRTRIGPLKLEGLGVGKFRPLTKGEVAALRRAAAKTGGARDTARTPHARGQTGHR
ncbi:MAG: rRNA pseudouridine synthase [Sedimentisphaerales bacterium]|nr:rRNA pseudouridine synthase [Sedimentisphaerales bacterium]